MVTILVNPPTPPDEYEGDSTEQCLENKICYYMCIDQENVFDFALAPKNSLIGPKNSQIDPNFEKM